MKLYNYLNKSFGNLKEDVLPVVVINKTSYFSFSFFLVGTLVGAIAALLYTPDSGENNIKKLTAKLKEFNEDKIDFNGRKTFNVRELAEGDEIKSLEDARAKMDKI